MGYCRVDCVAVVRSRPFDSDFGRHCELIWKFGAGTDNNNWTWTNLSTATTQKNRWGPSAAFNSSNIWLAAPKTFVWAREKLDGCERDRCCKVMLDADVYFRTAHEYFKAFTKCWEEKKDSDAKLAQQKVLWSELVEKVCMLQAAFSQVAQEKEALRAENVLLLPDNVELRSRLHEQQALGVRLQEKVHELEDDVQGLQVKVGELQVRCDGLGEELEVKDVENNKLRTSLEQGALDAPKIEEKPKAVPDVIKKGPPLALAAKRQSVDSDDEITFVTCVKRVKESEPTTTTAPCAAAVVANDQQKPAVPPAMAKDQQKPSVPPVVANDQQKPAVPPAMAKDQQKPSVPPVVANDQQKPSVPPVVAKDQQPM
uniref:TRAF-type domain-containing protein n=1 Tax=Globodera pallida TaxID=36090 RepID=A0A183BX37_GLOPA